MERKDDFNERRAHLAALTDDELKQRFWELTERIVDPLLELGYKNTTPSIERSVLMRMGFSSIEAKNIADKCVSHGLLGKGAGHVVYKVSQIKGISLRDAGVGLEQGNYWEDAEAAFKESGAGK